MARLASSMMRPSQATNRTSSEIEFVKPLQEKSKETVGNDINANDYSTFELDLSQTEDASYSDLLTLSKNAAEFPIYSINKKLVKCRPIERRNVKNKQNDLAIFNNYADWDMEYSSGYNKTVKKVDISASFDPYNSQFPTIIKEEIKTEKEKDLFLEIETTENENKTNALVNLASALSRSLRPSQPQTILYSEIEFVKPLKEKSKETPENDLNTNDYSRYELDLSQTGDANYSELLSTPRNVCEFSVYQINQKLVQFKPLDQRKIENRVVKEKQNDPAVFNKYSKWNSDYASDYSKNMRKNSEILASFDPFNSEFPVFNTHDPKYTAQKDSFFEIVTFEDENKPNPFISTLGLFSRALKPSQPAHKSSTDLIFHRLVQETTKEKSVENDINTNDYSNYELDLSQTEDAKYSDLLSTSRNVAEFPIYQINKNLVKCKPLDKNVIERRKAKAKRDDSAVFDLYTEWDTDYASAQYYKQIKKSNEILALFDPYNSKFPQSEEIIRSKNKKDSFCQVETPELQNQATLFSKFGKFLLSALTSKQNKAKTSRIISEATSQDVDNPEVLREIFTSDFSQFSQLQTQIMHYDRLHSFMDKFNINNLSELFELYQDSFTRAPYLSEKGMFSYNQFEMLPSPSDDATQFLWVDLVRSQNVTKKKPYFDDFATFPSDYTEYSRYYLIRHPGKFDFVNQSQRSGTPFFYVSDRHHYLEYFNRKFDLTDIVGFAVVSMGAISLLSYTFA